MVLHQLPTLHKWIIPTRVWARFVNRIFYFAWDSNLFIRNPICLWHLWHLQNHFLKIILRKILFRVSIRYFSLMITVKFMSAVPILWENLCHWSKLIHQWRGINRRDLCYIRDPWCCLLRYVSLKWGIILVLSQYFWDIWQLLLLLLLSRYCCFPCPHLALSGLKEILISIHHCSLMNDLLLVNDLALLLL